MSAARRVTGLVLDGRFADVVRRITSLHAALERESTKTRDVVERFEPMLASYTASAGESMAFVGGRLRELADEVRALSPGAVLLSAPEGLDELELGDNDSVVVALPPGSPTPDGWTVVDRLELPDVLLLRLTG